MFVNGHIYPAADRLDWGTSYSQRPLLFRNMRDGKFEEVPPVKGTGLAEIISGRGAAFGDLFNDGKIDVVINPIEGPPVLLKNVFPDHHHWVELKLVGGPKESARCGGRGRLSHGQWNAAKAGCAERRQLCFDQRPASAFRAGRCDGCRDGRDSLAVGRKGDGEASGCRSHLHDHRGAGHHGAVCAAAAVPCGRASARQSTASRSKP